MPSLTEEQKEVCRKLYKGVDGFQVQTLGGFAGTGKTTVIRTLHAKLPHFACCAYTGKAANVMRKKGMSQSSTIHSLIYRPVKHRDGTVTWDLLDPKELNCDGFIVDEASMVGREQHLDLLGFGKPVIYVGDHGQLEPVGSKFNLMQEPLYRLEEVHRNAGEIAHFAEHLRKGLPAREFKCERQVQIVSEKAVKDRHLAMTDQVICAYNKTRIELNKRARKELGFGEKVCVGDRVMCLRNNKRRGLFNGMQGVAVEVYKRKHLFDFESDGEIYPSIKFDPDQFGTETCDNSAFKADGPLPFDWCYAITCHKAQGDEWDNIIVFEQFCKHWEHTRWSYTAASRARKGLLYVAGKQRSYGTEFEE